MEHSLLVSFLDGKTSPEEFGRQIEAEVHACEQGFRSPANVGYIIITDGPAKTVTRENISLLLQALLDETIPWISVNYTGDCLMMSKDFEPQDMAVEEAIEFVADDSRPPTPDETRQVLSTLR